MNKKNNFMLKFYFTLFAFLSSITVSHSSSEGLSISNTHLLSVSQDGKYTLAYANIKGFGKDNDLILINNELGIIEKIIDINNGNESHGDISYDNKKILIGSNHGIYVYTLQNGAIEELPIIGRFPNYSKDSEYIKYHNGGGLHIYDVEKKVTIKSIHKKDSYYIQDAIFSKNNNVIFYAKCKHLNSSIYCDIYEYNLSSGVETQKTFYNKRSLLELIYFSDEGLLYGDGGLTIKNLKTGDVIPFSASNAKYNPIKKHFLFSRNDDAKIKIYYGSKFNKEKLLININNTLAINDNKIAKQNHSISINPMENDTGLADSLIKIINYDAVSKNNGKITKKEDDTLEYTPPIDFIGVDTFEYTIEDGNKITSTATVTITVKDKNHNPIATNDTATTEQDTAITIPDVLANDTDPDGDTLTISTFDAKSVQEGDIKKNEDDTLTYTPKSGFIGSDSFTYTISDGKDGIAIGTVNITITKPNSKPIAVEDLVSTPSFTAKIIDVLANDIDPDGDKLSILRFDSTSVEGGTITQNEDGTLTYTSKLDYTSQTEPDSFTYTVTDGKGGRAKTTVKVVVADCFIATAAFGSYLHADVEVLRNFRDDYLLTNAFGKSLVNFYYQNSPPIARYISERESLRTIVRGGLSPIIYGIKYPALLIIFVLSIVLWRKRKKIFYKGSFGLNNHGVT